MGSIKIIIGALGAVLFSSSAIAQFSGGTNDPFNSTKNSVNDPLSSGTDMLSFDTWGMGAWGTGGEIDEIITIAKRIREESPDVLWLLREWRSQEAQEELRRRIEEKLQEFDGGEGDEAGITDKQMCQLRQHLERDIDKQAENLASVIRSLNTPESNPNNNEFGAFILRLNDGRIVTPSNVTEGTTGTVSLDHMLADARDEFGDSIDASNIVGILHLHPRLAGAGFESVANISDLGGVDYGNTMPSHPNIKVGGANDWESARSFLLRSGRSDIGDVSHYILGPDGVLRQYDYFDRHPSEQTQQSDLINNAESNAKGECDESSS